MIDDVALDQPVDTRGLPAERRLRGATAVLFGALIAVLSFPLVVALVELRRPHWYPLLDMAQTEIRVRDVTSHPPLIGLAGRIGPFGPNGGSHPGPLSFYALWPVWKLFGGSSYGLFASNVVLDVVAFGLALWMALRRGGRALLLAIATVLAVLTRAYGAFLLTLPWNPYLPVLWWFVFVLAVWSVLADDLVMLPVVVVAGSFCMQTHISYLGLVSGLVLLVAVVLGVRAYQGRGDADTRRALWRWGGISVATGVVLWIPPVIDQFAHSPGNLGLIRDYFSHPPAAPIGFRRGVEVVLAQLDPWRLLTRTLVRDSGALEVTGSRLPGTLLLIAFGASVIVAWRLRRRALLLLDAVLVAALVLGFVGSARIFGTVWFYLMLWAWGLTALMLFAIVWSAVELVRVRTPDDRTTRDLARAGGAVLATATLVASVVFAFQASSVTVQTPRINESLGALVGPTADALTRLEHSGQRGPYLVTWLPDAQAIGSAGFGLLNELDRRGFDVRAGEAFRPGATRYHVIDARKPSLEVHLATGPDIANWRHDSRFTQVGSFDPRSDAERAEFDRLHAVVAGDLRRAGLGDLVAQIDDNLFMLALAPRVPASARRSITQMLGLGMPMAVFVGPPSSADSSTTMQRSDPADHDSRWFRPALALVVVGALAVRLAYVFISRRNFDPHGDAFFYHGAANLLAEGKGFISPFFVGVGLHRAAAEHPPLYTIFLAIPSVLGMKSVLSHLVWSCLLGSGTVWLVGLLGRAVGGHRVGIVAAVIAALYPNMWAPDGMLQAETVSMFAATAAVLLAYRYWQRPSWRRLVLVGAACGAGALARSELILLLPLVVVPLAWTTRDRAWRERLQWLGAAVIAGLVVIAPWTIYNTTRFVHPVLLSAQFDPLLASANCDSVYYGQLQGYFDIQCAIAIANKEGLTLRDDESQEDLVYRHAALDYVRGNLSRLPVVEGVRLLRIVGLYKTSLYVRADWFVEGRDPLWVSWAGLYSFWVLALLSIAGVFVHRRAPARVADGRAPPLYPLIAPLAVVLVTVLVTYASTRFRTTAEPSLTVLAALAVVAPIDAAWTQRRGSET